MSSLESVQNASQNVFSFTEAMSPLPLPEEETIGVYFDFGGVISVPATIEWEKTLYPYCESLGISRMMIENGFRAYRSLWDGDMISFVDFYTHIFAEAKLPPPTAEQIKTLWHYDAEEWVRQLRPDTFVRMQALKASGRRIGILSNMSSDFYNRLFISACADYRKLVDVEVISGLEHLCKPDRAIYDLAADRIGLKPSQLLFYDDTYANVEAARACGWRAEIYPLIESV